MISPLLPTLMIFHSTVDNQRVYTSIPSYMFVAFNLGTSLVDAAPSSNPIVQFWQTSKYEAKERLAAMPPLSLDTSVVSPQWLSRLRLLNSSIVWIDPKTVHQEIVGFGGAFTQSSAQVWQSISHSLRDEVIAAYFDSKSGLGYSVGRVCISVIVTIEYQFSDCRYRLTLVTSRQKRTPLMMQMRTMIWYILTTQ